MSNDSIAKYVRNLVTTMGFDLRKSLRARDMELEAKVMDKFAELGISSTDFEPLKHIHQSGCQYASLCHKDQSMDLKVYIAVYTALVIAVDDLLLDVPAMRTFTHNFGTHEAQGHPVLDCLVHLLRLETPKFFGPFGTNIIITSTLDGVNGLALEAMFPRGFPRAMPGFSCWQRTSVGYGAAYGYFIFPTAEFPESEYLSRYVQILPSLRDILCWVNDVLSFYKERVLAKEVCCISNLAQEKSISELSSLELVCDSALSLDKRIREALGEDETVLGAYVEAILGYIEWHFQVKRYRLHELGLTLKS
ncbi:Trichodiene synthase [Trichoderma ghanense]|uniref:Trichodiene synthase n=1 Tax=Trichoderma ghanense TaxID=65468 RepID=A0ABY2HAE6_9HYPO